MSQRYKLPIMALGIAIGFALALPVSAEPAKEPKQKKQTVAPKAERTKMGYRGADKFRAGPLYNGIDYLGDDPDPFIRLQIQRDLGARYPGDF